MSKSNKMHRETPSFIYIKIPSILDFARTAMHFHRTLFINWLLPGNPIFHFIAVNFLALSLFLVLLVRQYFQWVKRNTSQRMSHTRRVAPSDYCILHNIKFFPLAHGRIEFEWSELHTHVTRAPSSRHHHHCHHYTSVACRCEHTVENVCLYFMQRYGLYNVMRSSCIVDHLTHGCSIVQFLYNVLHFLSMLRITSDSLDYANDFSLGLMTQCECILSFVGDIVLFGAPFFSFIFILRLRSHQYIPKWRQFLTNAFSVISIYCVAQQLRSTNPTRRIYMDSFEFVSQWWNKI